MAAASSTADTSADISQSVFNESVISERFQAHSKDGKKKVHVTPLLVDFRRLLQSTTLTDSHTLVPGIKNHDLLHAVVGLYDIALTDLTPDVIYSTVCDKWARTMLLLRDIKDVFLEFEMKRDRYNRVKQPVDLNISEASETTVSTDDAQKDNFKPDQAAEATFSCCYSDTDSSESEDNDDDDDEDFSKGINRFLEDVRRRRLNRLQHNGPYHLEHIGPENRIIAACTFGKKYVRTGEKIVHLTLLSVRKRYQKLGLGKFLIQQIKDPIVAGPHDAVVVHAENEAKQFFARYGFSDDVILNNKWREIAEQFTNCSLMTYTPPYSGQAIPGEISEFDLVSLEQDLSKWKGKSMEAYQAQVTIIERMKAEMRRLRAMVCTQEEHIASLTSRIRSMDRQKLNIDSEDLIMKEREEMHALEKQYRLLGEPTPLPEDQLIDDDHTVRSRPPLVNTNSDLELMRYAVNPKNSGEIYDHGKDIAEFHQICQDFKASLKTDPKIKCDYTVISVSKALLNSNAVERYAAKLRQASLNGGDGFTVLKLYYCGSKENPDRLKDILKNGFSNQDYVDGDFGKGLYFSQSASTAANFSAPFKVLVAEVMLGYVQFLQKKEKGRKFPDEGYHTIQCPGRLIATCGDEIIVQEYVIFDCSHALPLDLIEYTPSQN